MDRRQFLTASKPIKRTQSARPFRTMSGLNPYTGPWTKNEVQHLLKRVMFGSTRNDILYFAGKNVNDAVDELLNPTTPLPTPPVNDYNSATVTDPVVALGQTWVNNPTNDGTLNSLRRASFKKWWTGLMINQDRSIREKLTLFWTNHFATESVDISFSHYVYHHHALLRQNALGNFRQLVKDVTVDAGMLRYLNGYLNTNTAPDENYARELQELFTIGKDPVTGLAPYTEDDVKKAAKVLTGWRINGTTFTVFFDPARHDSSSKTFSSFYNGATITGRTGAAGAAETDDLLSMIFQKTEVSENIVRRLYRWFVYYEIDAATENNVIIPLATIFRSNNYQIKPVLAALFKSEHFYDVLNQGCLIKSPIEYVVSLVRETGISFPQATDYVDLYNMWNYLRGWMASMTQDPGDPPSVSGWPAYYQAPQFHEIWINSDTLPKRNRYVDTMIFTGYTRNGKKIVVDAVNYVKTLPNAGDPNWLIDELLSVFFRAPLSAASKQTIKQQILLTGQSSDHYWTDAWNQYMAAPGNTNNYNIVNTRLKTLFQYLTNLPEYHLS